MYRALNDIKDANCMILEVSNALIMDRGTSRNILTELNMNKNQYNLVTTMYYVRGMESNSSES
jgi:hypothetical protein